MDVRAKRATREVVDGQQRLRAIFSFSDDEFALSSRAKEFDGYRYSTMPADLQETFLSYPIAVDQLINASDSEVLEVFARLNSYTVLLNAAEKRHAKYQGEFKWTVYELAQKWEELWEEYHIITKTARFRMDDDSLMAQLLGILINGVTDGDERAIDKLYAQNEASFPNKKYIVNSVNIVLDYVTSKLSRVVVGPLASPPHFVMLFAAVAHALIGIPPGLMNGDMPERSGSWLSNVDAAIENLTILSAAIEQKDTTGALGQFVNSSLSNAHRIASRRVRFPIFCRALGAVPINQ